MENFIINLTRFTFAMLGPILLVWWLAPEWQQVRELIGPTLLG